MNGCIPAVVSSTDGSYDDGINDADGMRLWSRSSKNERYVSRISADDRGGLMGTRSRGAANASIALRSLV